MRTHLIRLTGVLALGAVFALSACHMPLEPPPEPPVLAVMPPPEPEPVVIEIDIISMSHSIADALIAELRKNHPNFHPHKPILVTSFVDLAELDTSSELGLLMSDQISTRLTQQGYSVVEAKLRQDLAVRQNEGEFIMSREIERLSQEYQAYAVVVGNYTRGNGILYMNSRIIQLKNKQVLASVSAKAPIGDEARRMLTATGGGLPLPVVNQ
ncbi:MAG: FlgO family outer membrane protein [Magnetococcus sp. WYHC-3]